MTTNNPAPGAAPQPANTFDPNDPTGMAHEDLAASADPNVVDAEAERVGLGDRAQAAILGSGTLGHGDKEPAGAGGGATGEQGGLADTMGQESSMTRPVGKADVKDNL